MRRFKMFTTLLIMFFVSSSIIYGNEKEFYGECVALLSVNNGRPHSIFMNPNNVVIIQFHKDKLKLIKGKQSFFGGKLKKRNNNEFFEIKYSDINKNIQTLSLQGRLPSYLILNLFRKHNVFGKEINELIFSQFKAAPANEKTGKLGKITTGDFLAFHVFGKLISMIKDNYNILNNEVWDKSNGSILTINIQ